MTHATCQMTSSIWTSGFTTPDNGKSTNVASTQCHKPSPKSQYIWVLCLPSQFYHIYPVKSAWKADKSRGSCGLLGMFGQTRRRWDVGPQKLCHLNLITGTAPPSKCWKWDRLSKENENKKISDTRTHTHRDLPFKLRIFEI